MQFFNHTTNTYRNDLLKEMPSHFFTHASILGNVFSKRPFAIVRHNDKDVLVVRAYDSRHNVTKPLRIICGNHLQRRELHLRVSSGPWSMFTRCLVLNLDGHHLKRIRSIR